MHFVQMGNEIFQTKNWRTLHVLINHTHTHTHILYIHIYSTQFQAHHPQYMLLTYTDQLLCLLLHTVWTSFPLHISVFQFNHFYKLILHYRWYLEQCVTNQSWQQSTYKILITKYRYSMYRDEIFICKTNIALMEAYWKEEWYYIAL